MRTGAEIIDYHDRLLSNRVSWDTHWQELAEFIMPRKARVNTGTANGPPDGVHDRLYDSTGVSSCQKLAGGCMAWITPAGGDWFLLAPDDMVQQDEEAEEWLAKCTEVIRKMLAESNFYTEVHELYLDRSGFGTANLYEDYNTAKMRLHFRNMPVGSYVCAEDAEGMVDTVIYCKPLTARAAAQMFGENALPEKVRKDAEDPKTWGKEYQFLHAVFPRKDFKGRSPFASNFPIASVWVERQSKEIVSESGFLDMPYFVTRFLRWEQSQTLGLMAGGSGPWGWSPGWAALPDMRQLNELEKSLDALADRQVNPPILMPEELDTRADLRPGGVTLYNAAMGAAGVPQTWADGGRYDVGLQRAEEKRNRIRDHFMVGLFSMFQEMQGQGHKQMTATEVSARLSEKIDQMSPTFALLSTELLTPVLTRTFSLALQHQRLPGPIPRSLVNQDPATGQLQLLKPKVQFNSRLAIAIEASQDQGFMRFLEFVVNIAGARPEIWDNIDWDAAARRHFRLQGGDQDLLVPKGQMEAQRLQRAQMAAQLSGVEGMEQPAA